MRAVAFLLGLLVIIGMPADAHAHLVNTRLGDFYGGMLHPLSGLEDALAWLALAILAALQGPALARWLIAVFPLGLLVGSALALAVPGLPFMPGLGIALIAIVGVAVATAVTLPPVAFLALGATVALANGYQNGQAMTDATDHLLFIAGLTAVGYAFMTFVTALVIAFVQGHGGWRQIVLRASGSWVAAIGIMTLGLQMVRPGM
jgi:urease accessory protein